MQERGYPVLNVVSLLVVCVGILLGEKHFIPIRREQEHYDSYLIITKRTIGYIGYEHT